ncbi:hypothetical protein B0H14DRAFT_558049 [Mycena olivaceomarginata]|nr:hypothetical protein B0H14DRAFT_558049 [Mycena olivaceomarginata]
MFRSQAQPPRVGRHQHGRRSAVHSGQARRRRQDQSPGRSIHKGSEQEKEKEKRAVRLRPLRPLLTQHGLVLSFWVRNGSRRSKTRESAYRVSSGYTSIIVDLEIGQEKQTKTPPSSGRQAAHPGAPSSAPHRGTKPRIKPYTSLVRKVEFVCPPVHLAIRRNAI